MLRIGIVAAAALGAALVVKRRELAELQSLVIGGRLTPGCVLFQAALVRLLAVLGIVAWLAGWIR